MLKRKRRFRYPGRKPISDRAALTGILFVLKTGIGWESLPQEMGCGSGMTCWRRQRDWQKAGVWDKIHQILLAQLRKVDQIDFSRAIVDSSSVCAGFGGQKTGPNPTDRRKAGSKHHLIPDANGIPLAHKLTEANRHDVTQTLPLVHAIPAIGGKPGRPQKRPEALQEDRAYHSQTLRESLRKLGIVPLLAKRYTEHGSGLGKTRWVIERYLSWLHQFKRLRQRYERRSDIHDAFLRLSCALICFNVLQNSFC
ncbi:MAG TPA: IS5 family transposase [Anaerohalosphaeraceae bacterium]|nr:IS5 family transposase [Anaerohalosphaeraceae bacterium]